MDAPVVHREHFAVDATEENFFAEDGAREVIAVWDLFGERSRIPIIAEADFGLVVVAPVLDVIEVAFVVERGLAHRRPPSAFDAPICALSSSARRAQRHLVRCAA